MSKTDKELQSASSTKRFEKYHKSWTGNTNWQVPTHRENQKVEELDDDDYASAWLECLKLGIPWGGRGAGGRGIQRSTGQSQNILVENVSVARGTTQILENAVLKLNYSTRYGLIGRNGAGKSTLLKRMATGTLPGFPPYVRVSKVEQEINFNDPEISMMSPAEFVLKFDFERTNLLNEESEILSKLEDTNSSEEELINLNERLSEVYAHLDQIDAFNAEKRSEEILQKVGFVGSYKHLLSRKMSQLSGGWQMRACLAGSLITNPDLLLLDESSNNLDYFGLNFLQKFLQDKTNFSGCVVVVSHDRNFIENVCEEIIVLAKHKLSYFSGKYHEYVKQKSEKISHQAKKSQAIAKQKDKLKDFIAAQNGNDVDQKKLKMVKTKAKKIERLDRIGFGASDGHRYREQVDHSMPRFKVYIPNAVDIEEKPINFSIPLSESTLPPTSRVVGISKFSFSVKIIKNAEVKFAKVCDNFEAEVRKDSRIAILGKNGCGKTTLFKLILRKFDDSAEMKLIDTAALNSYVKVDSGQISVDTSARVGYFSQDSIVKLPKDETPVETIIKTTKILQGRTMSELDARQYLGKFGIKDKLGIRKIELLSGGQKSRVVFALQSLKNPDVMFLDEPSNHLDIESLEKLSESLQKFNGGVITISHDKDFVSEVCDEIWIINRKKSEIRKFVKGENQNRAEFVGKVFELFLKL